MATIGNRYDALLLNARDPLDESKKKSKQKTNERPKSKPKASQKSDGTKKTVEITQSNKSPDVSKKSTKITVRDVTPINSIETPLASSDHTETVSTSSQIKVTVYSKDSEGMDVNIDEKDDRALRPRSTYRKMIVSRGRVFDRKGVPSSSSYHSEKRRGHGAYNWGEEGRVENGQTDLDDSHQPAETATEPADQKATIEYTLDQYKELLRENKVDPLAYVENNAAREATDAVEEDTNTREYQYFRKDDDGQRGRGSGRSYRGRGSTRGRGRGYRGQSESRTYDSQSRRGNTPAAKQFVFDDIKEFPSL